MSYKDLILLWGVRIDQVDNLYYLNFVKYFEIDFENFYLKDNNYFVSYIDDFVGDLKIEGVIENWLKLNVL